MLAIYPWGIIKRILYISNLYFVHYKLWSVFFYVLFLFIFFYHAYVLKLCFFFFSPVSEALGYTKNICIFVLFTYVYQQRLGIKIIIVIHSKVVRQYLRT